MKDKVIDHLVNYVKKNKKLTEIEEVKIKYGFETIYILITKTIFIFTIALLLGFFKEMIIFLLLFNVIRTVAFGLHATNSHVCLIVSSLLFIGLPYISSIIILPNVVKIILGIILILLMFKNSPADTKKRPIISKKRRKVLKILSTFVAVIYVTLSFFTKDFISNCLLFSLLLEAIFISPVTYKIFKLPYNNYLNYIRKEDLNVS